MSGSIKVPLNLEISSKPSRLSMKRCAANTNISNSDLDNELENNYDDKNYLVKNPTNEDLADSTNFRHLEAEDEYLCDNYYCLPVEERSFLWNVAREKKLESIRKMNNSSDLEECTFQPQLITNRVSRRRKENIDGTSGSSSEYHTSTLTSNSVQKYIYRMSKAREMKQKKQEEQDSKPGSGKIWKNQRTVPREPRLRVCSQRDRSQRQRSSSMAELSKIISLHNLSVQNLDLNCDFEDSKCEVYESNRDPGIIESNEFCKNRDFCRVRDERMDKSINNREQYQEFEVEIRNDCDFFKEINDRDSGIIELDDRDSSFNTKTEKYKPDLYMNGNHLQQLNFKSFGVDSFQIRHQSLKLDSTSTHDKENNLKQTNTFGNPIIHDKTLDLMQQILDSQSNSRKLSKADSENREFSQMNIKIGKQTFTPNAILERSPASCVVCTTMSNDNFENMKQNLHNEILSLNI